MTPAARAALLDSLTAGASFTAACRGAGTTPTRVRALAADDDTFAEQLEAAEASGGVARAPAPIAPTPPPTRRLPQPAPDSPLDLAAITREAATYAPGPLGHLLWLDARLVLHGFPGMSAWWKWDLGRFYESGKRWGVYSVGRGGGKSTSLVRVAGSEGIFGEREIPPGQRWIWPFISVSTSDARRRIVEIQAILAAIGIAVTPKYPQGHPTIETTDARGQPIAFVSIASTIAGVSGPSTIGATIDEEAKLRDRVTNANPSTEILASLLQTFRARPGIRAIRCSSAWTTVGSHASAIAEGDTDANHVGRIGDDFLEDAVRGLRDVARWEAERGDLVASERIFSYAATLTAQSPAIPTWIGNPTISALASREEIEAMPSGALGGISRATYWLRENASVPTDASASKYAMAAAQCIGLGEANRRLCAGQPQLGTMTQYPNPELSYEDPRSAWFQGGRHGSGQGGSI